VRFWRARINQAYHTTSIMCSPRMVPDQHRLCGSLNLNLRQHVAAIGRRVTALWKGEDGLRQQLVLFQVDHNCVLPYARICVPLPQPEPTNGTNSTTKWRPCISAMSVGLMDRIWTLREVPL
jgi:hypothetical protein